MAVLTPLHAYGPQTPLVWLLQKPCKPFRNVSQLVHNQAPPPSLSWPWQTASLSRWPPPVPPTLIFLWSCSGRQRSILQYCMPLGTMHSITTGSRGHDDVLPIQETQRSPSEARLYASGLESTLQHRWGRSHGRSHSSSGIVCRVCLCTSIWCASKV